MLCHMRTASFLRARVVLTGGLFSSFFKRTLGRFAVLAAQLQLFINLLKLCVPMSLPGVPAGLWPLSQHLSNFFHCENRSKVRRKWHICHSKHILGSFFFTQMLSLSAVYVGLPSSRVGLPCVCLHCVCWCFRVLQLRWKQEKDGREILI